MSKARLLLIPVLAGLVAAIAAYVTLPARTAPGAPIDLVPAVVAKEAVPVRTKLSSSLFLVRQVPRELAAGAVASLDEVEGRINTQPLAAGEIMLRERLADPERGALTYRIPAGKRAITIRVDEMIGVAGYPQPGDRVDVVAAIPAAIGSQEGATGPEMEVRLLLENVEVLAQGTAPAQSREGEKPAGGLGGSGQGGGLTSYTLAVEPRQALEIVMMEQIGALKLVLRPALAEPDAGRLRITDLPYRPEGS